MLIQCRFTPLLFMYVVELVLRNVAMPISVQRKEAADADQLYAEIMSAIKSNQPGHLLELTCEQQTDKKAAVFVSDVAAVQTYNKSSTPATGRAAGFATA
jgi:hypothetical protein